MTTLRQHFEDKWILWASKGLRRGDIIATWMYVGKGELGKNNIFDRTSWYKNSLEVVLKDVPVLTLEFNYVGNIPQVRMPNNVLLDTVRNVSSGKWMEGHGSGSLWSRLLYFPSSFDPLTNVDEMDKELLKTIVDFTLPFLSGVCGEEE